MGLEWVGLGISDKGKEAQIMKLCRKLNIRTKQFQKRDYDRTVSEVAGLGALKEETGKKVKMPEGYQPADIILFSGFTDERLDVFLQSYREAGIEPVALKATVTLYNVGWSLYALEQELTREHNEMQARQK